MFKYNTFIQLIILVFVQGYPYCITIWQTKVNVVRREVGRPPYHP